MPPKKADWTENFKKKQVGVSDMTLLSKVDNDHINDNLEKRFFGHDIYTYIGHVLISVNPFKDLGLYTEDILRSYTGKNRLEMPPHVFAIAESAYYNMTSYKENQCVIISGESGAGKTEAAKKIMSYIATVSGGQSDAIQQVKDMVLATNPLLESFGCAKTLRNNNSSRHGKYLEIQFNANGEPTGAHITNYLLEKNRVISQIKGERNFHIFYQFCRGASQEYKDLFGISGPDAYWYTNQSGSLNVDGMDDIAEYQGTLQAMEVIGLTDDERHGIHRVLATILWLGNTQFTEGDNNNSFISDPNVTDFVSYLLETDSNLLEKTLVTRVMETKRGGRRGSIYDVPLNPDQAAATRDGLAKALYDRLFDWIVDRINSALKQSHHTDFANVIGVLDIYGFEIFDHNSFEQLCINYVNEKLQQIFIELTLKAEQDEYVAEKIQWTPIKFFNNKIVCDLIEEKRPPGIFAALNDACATAHADPAAADSSFIQRLGLCAANPHLEQRGQSFLVKHYAGDVSYEIRGMTDKNKDQLSKDLLTLVQSSASPFLLQLFPDQVDQDSKRRPPSASDRIRTSAAALVTNLMRAQPSYIRCIKPNSNKSPAEYDRPMSLHQIKYLGLCENIRVRRAGFASRQTFEKFVERFFLLSKQTSYAGEYIWRGDARTGTEVILKEIGIPQDEWQLGVTKAFIRHPETLWSLESLRDKYWHTMATRIQRAWRRWLAYRSECAAKIQRCYRKNKDQIVQLRVRDSSHQLLSQRKERRRFSLLSMRRFHGDYLLLNNTMDSTSGGAALRTAGNIPTSEPVLFSSKVMLLVPRPLRSSKPSPRMLILTNAALYVLATVVEKKLAQIKLERKVALANVTKVSLSNLRDDWVIIHVPGEVDLVLSTFLKTELVTHLHSASNRRLTIDVSSSVEYTKKPGKSGSIKFIKDELETKYDTYKNHTVSVGSGFGPDSVSDPPCARIDPPVSSVSKSTYKPKPKSQPKPKPQQSTSTSPPQPNRAMPPPPPSNPPPPPSHQYKAIYDYQAEDPNSSFTKDTVFEIIQKDNNGWWLASRGDGVQSWVPSNYLEEVIQQQPVAPPPLPRPAPVPSRPSNPVAPQEEEQEEVQVKPAIAPRPVPKPRPMTNSQSNQPNGTDNPQIPAWKAELQARQKSANGSELGGGHHSRQASSSGGPPSIPSRPNTNNINPPSSASSRSTPPIPNKPNSMGGSMAARGGSSSVAQLANALGGNISGSMGNRMPPPRPGIPARTQTPADYDEGSSSSPPPVVNRSLPPSIPSRPVVPSRPGPPSSSGGGGKPKPPPRPPIPPRN